MFEDEVPALFDALFEAEVGLETDYWVRLAAAMPASPFILRVGSLELETSRFLTVVLANLADFDD